MTSIKFCTDKRLAYYKKFELLKDHINEKQSEIEVFNGEKKHDKSNLLNGRNLTNIGLFREYARQYLLANEHLRKDLTLMVRQLPPTEYGLPI
ncbi:MAG: mechanosensitive ion channel family protein, partial [Bacteroidetes bacterium]|nr:mechanosensitive ion channel family protein [Bacteroidota bacterium]